MYGLRYFICVVAALAAVGGAVAVWSQDRTAVSQSSTTSTATPPAPAPQKQLDPLTIEAIRARSYPGSAVSVIEDRGLVNGYHEHIVSYLSDGLKIRALMDTPARPAPAAGWPVIILNHGYINPPDYQTADSDYRSFIAAFTGAGYMVVKPDFRGHGSSEGTPEGGHFSPVYAYDELNLIASLKQYKDVDAKRIGLFGHSMGAHVALRTIVASKDIKATVFMAGVVGSFNDLFYNWPHSPAPGDQPKPVVQGKKLALVAQYGEPKDNPDFWNSVSAINYVDAVTGAVQVNHDANDSTVPKLFSDHLTTALQGAHKPVQEYIYPGDDHQFTQNRALFLQRAIDFYNANL